MNARSDIGPEHEELQVLLGAFVLGGLDPVEHQAFSRHLRSCSVCQHEAAQVSGLPALLDLAEPAAVADLDAMSGEPREVDQPAVLVPAALLDRVRHERRRRRWRLTAVAAAVAILAGGVGASIGPILSRVNAPETRALVAAPAAGAATPAQVEVDLVTRTWGTELDLRGSSLPTGEVLYLAVTDKSGHRYDVASWTGTPSGRTTLTAACWMRSADIAMVEVHTRAGQSLAMATA